MDEGHRRFDTENLGSLEEEGAKLAVEEGEALVHLDLRLVGLDLREVGVDRQVGREVRGDPVLDVDPGVRIHLPGTEGGDGRVDRSVLDRRDGGEELEIPARGDVRHPLEDPHLREETRLVARHGGPDLVLLILPLDLPDDLEAPAVRLSLRGRRVAEALEGDRHLGDEAVLHDPRPGLEEGVPRPVRRRDRLGDRPGACPEAAPSDRHDAVPLDPVAVDVEVVAALLVEEGVEVDRHQVVRRGAVALHPVRPHHGDVLVVDVESEVDVVGVVGDVGVRRLRARGALDRGLLGELRQVLGAFPRLVVEDAVECGGNGGSSRSRPRPARDEAELLGGGEPPLERLRGALLARPGGLGDLPMQLGEASGEEREEQRPRRAGEGPEDPSARKTDTPPHCRRTRIAR